MHRRDPFADPRPVPRRSILLREGYTDGWTVVVMLRRTQHLIEVAMDQALDGHGVSFAQYRALLLVERNPTYISYAARSLRITRQAADRLYLKLAEAGLVRRIRAGHVTDVEITDLGRKRLRMMNDLVRDLVVQPIEYSVQPRELFALEQLLVTVDDSLRPSASPTWWLDD
jgi:DNA-binding MarR family transcriptional regulator